MKLKGFPLTDIKYHMQVAEAQKRANEPVKIKLFIKNGENLERVKRDLAENYRARNVDSYEIFSKKGEDILFFADVPAKNLRKVVEEKYVRRYGWPDYLEALSEDKQTFPSTVGLGFRAPDTIEVLNEPKPKPEEIGDFINRRGQTNLDY